MFDRHLSEHELDPLEGLWGERRGSLEPLGDPRASPGDPLASLGGSKGVPGAVLGGPGGSLGWSRRVLGGLCGILEGSLERSGRSRGVPWGTPGGPLGAPGGSLGSLAGSQGGLKTIEKPLVFIVFSVIGGAREGAWRSLGGLGRPLRPSERVLGGHLGFFGRSEAQSEDTLRVRDHLEGSLGRLGGPREGPK